MPRPAKPYLCRGWYVTNLGGKRHRLCPEADGLRAARDALARLRQEVEGNGGRAFPSLTIANGTWVRNHQAPRPYKPRTVNHAVISVKRCWNWAIENDLLPDRNPFDACVIERGWGS
jgi:hypothetical protein